MKSFKIFSIIGLLLIFCFGIWFLYCQENAIKIGAPDGQWVYFEFIIALCVVIPIYFALSILIISLEFTKNK